MGNWTLTIFMFLLLGSVVYLGYRDFKQNGKKGRAEQHKKLKKTIIRVHNKCLEEEQVRLVELEHQRIIDRAYQNGELSHLPGSSFQTLYHEAEWCGKGEQ